MSCFNRQTDRCQLGAVPGPKYKAYSSFSGDAGVSFGLPFDGGHKESEEKSDVKAYVGFGFGCSMAEHARYGRCLDGKCSLRSNHEKTNALLKARAANRGRKVKTHSQTAKSHTVKSRGEKRTSTPTQGMKGAKSTPVHQAAKLGDFHVVDLLLQGSMVWNPSRQCESNCIQNFESPTFF